MFVPAFEDMSFGNRYPHMKNVKNNYYGSDKASIDFTFQTKSVITELFFVSILMKLQGKIFQNYLHLVNE